MHRQDRPVPFPYGTPEWRNEFARLRGEGKPASWVRRILREANRQARWYPVKGEKCQARTRKGTPCQAPAGWNGRCKLHGGLSSGPKTLEGKAKALSKLRPHRACVMDCECRGGLASA